MTTRASVVRRFESEARRGATGRTPGLRRLVTPGSPGCLSLSVNQMKEIELSSGQTALVDDEDFELLSKHRWYLTKKGYAYRSHRANGQPRTMRMHRQILGAPPDKQVDHINGNRLDNRKANLRLVTSQQNRMNSKKRANSRSGLKGVIWDATHSRWLAAVTLNGNRYNLGVFPTPEAAHEAYKAKAKELFGEFARFE